jgi:thiamine biosynthesis lipoprotein
VAFALRELWAGCILLVGLSLFFHPSYATERISGTAENLEIPSVNRSTSLMTTTVDFQILLTSDSHSATAANVAIDSAIDEIKRVTQVFSEWEPKSEISAVNKAAGEKAVPVSPEVFRLISEALRISELSNGKFDITFKSAGKLWDFRKKTIPEATELKRAAAAINYQHVALDEEKQTVFLTKAGTQIGLGGIAKGYAIDRAVQVIRNAGFDMFYINAGGDLYASSGASIKDNAKNSAKRWKVGIQHPDNTDRLIAVLPVANGAVATSGDYERYFEKNGTRYHHIIDPDTGYPANLSRSVTVLTSRAYLADALATAVFVLGPEKGVTLIENMPEAEVLIIDKRGEIVSTLPHASP